jgi:unsaturated rhamnogalacturonyl hydrolase
MKTDEVLEKVKRALLAMQRYSWEQGVTAQAYLEAGETEWVILFAKDAVVRSNPDGRLGIMGGGDFGDLNKSDDPAVNGEPVLYAAEKTGDPRLKKAADDMLSFLLHRANKTDDGTLCQFSTAKIVHSDGIYLSIPYLAVAGQPIEAIKQIDGYRRCLWNQEKKLFSHVWDDDAKKFVRKDFWGVGNGWAAAGMLRVIKALPPDFDRKEKQRIIGYFQDVVDGCLAHVRSDGLFHDIVDSPRTFVETNLSQMLSYVIFRAVPQGWIDESYLKHARSMRKAARSKVDRYGLVQGVCASPTFDYPGTAPEGQAFFILMEVAAREAGE